MKSRGLMALGMALTLAAGLAAQTGAVGMRPAAAAELAPGIALFQKSHFRQAAQFFRMMEARAPGKSGALLWLAKCRINLGQLEEAQTDLEVYLKRHPRSDDAESLLGFVYYRLRQPRASLAAYARAAALRPPLGDDYKIMGLDYIALRQWPQAERELEQAVKLEPDNPQAQYFLAWMEYIANHFTRARGRLEALARQQPRNLAAASLLGLVLIAQSHYAQASRVYRRAIALEPKLPRRDAQPYIGYGILLEKTGHLHQAAGELRQGLAIKPDSFRAHAHLGHIELMLNQLPAAERELKRALSLNPRYRPAYYQLAQIYRREGKHELERQALEQLAKLPLRNVPQ